MAVLSETQRGWIQAREEVKGDPGTQILCEKGNSKMDSKG